MAGAMARPLTPGRGAATRTHLAPPNPTGDIGGGGWRRAEPSPTRSGPEGSSRNEFRFGSSSSLHPSLIRPGPARRTRKPAAPMTDFPSTLDADDPEREGFERDEDTSDMFGAPAPPP